MDPLKQELVTMLQIILDQIDDDPGAIQFFDLRLIAQAKELIAKVKLYSL